MGDEQLRNLRLLRSHVKGNKEQEAEVDKAIMNRKRELGFDKAVEIRMEETCQCGKEKHNFFRHSDWCPMFEG